MLHGDEAEEFVPTLHHPGGVVSTLAGEVADALTLGERLYVLQHLRLVGCVEVLQFLLRLTQVAYHGAVARINHVGHQIVQPEGAVLAELVVHVVLTAEGFGHLIHAAIHRHVGYHVGIVAVEVHDASHLVGQPAAKL